MKTNDIVLTLATITSLCALSNCTAADTFGSGAQTFEIEFVTIGDPGNAADTTGNPVSAGSVPYTFRISKFEISEQIIDKANALAPLGITKDSRGKNKPATSVTWFEAAMFVNWLNTTSGGTSAYKFDGSGNLQLWTDVDAGFTASNPYRNSRAAYWLPSLDEWYKAAYYDAESRTYFDYPTGSNTPPVVVDSGTAAGTAVYDRSHHETGPADVTSAGGLSPFGTMGQGGNVWEWEETDYDLRNGSGSSDRGIRGGSWDQSANLLSVWGRVDVEPMDAGDTIGFRVASVPEPSALLLGAIALVGLLMLRRAADEHFALSSSDPFPCAPCLFEDK